MSVAELGEPIKARPRTRSPITLVLVESVVGAGFEETADRAPDCSNTGATTGFAPQTTLDRIIDTVADFNANRAA